MDRGDTRFGGHEALVALDDAFVPWDRVFLCGKTDFSGGLVEKFASHHRQRYACKMGAGDLHLSGIEESDGKNQD